MPNPTTHAPRISVKVDAEFKKSLVAACDRVGVVEAVLVRHAVLAAIEYVRAAKGTIGFPLVAMPRERWDDFQARLANAETEIQRLREVGG